MSAIETALTELSANLRRMEQRHQATGYKFDRLYDLIAAAREELAGLTVRVEVPRMDPEEVNALPEKARDYIHQLSANADPSGMVRENMQLLDVNNGLQLMYRKAADALEEVKGCFHAAGVEGLQETLAETSDERLKDLVERRLMYALHIAEDATGGANHE